MGLEPLHLASRSAFAALLGVGVGLLCFLFTLTHSLEGRWVGLARCFKSGPDPLLFQIVKRYDIVSGRAYGLMGYAVGWTK